MRNFQLIEKILLFGLVVSLLCSVVICYRVYVLNDHTFKSRFSTWQMPMILAIIADLYFIQ
jgi:Na+-transporting NADH:ubiquinone oxidoreductase subunit NqrC